MSPSGRRSPARSAFGALAGVALGAAGLSLVAAAPPLPESDASLEGGDAGVDVDANANAPPAREPPEPAFTSRLGPRFDDDSSVTPRARRIASYTLRAKLDADEHRIEATGTIHWTNTSGKPVEELYVHLYLNAFKNDETVFLRSRFGGGRSGTKAKQYGYVDISKLSARELGGVDLWRKADPHTPGDPADETDIRIPLPEPVEPGAQLTLDIAFESQLPNIVERTGFAGDFHMAAQWFPKLARLEPDGTWAHFPFHAQSEFYADFGTYDVTLDVPERMKVGATGVRTEARVEGGRRIVRHRVQSVHDFAWTAWDGFVEQTEVMGKTSVRLLYPVGHERNAEVTFEALRHALPSFGAKYGEYPYPVLTVVHPPESAKNAGGMEYPTLFTTGGPWWSGHLSRGVEGVTIHELGHQWFYGLVATDERAWPFLDEGINTFAENQVRRERWGEGTLLDLPGLKVATDHLMRGVAVATAHRDVTSIPAAEFATFRDYGGLVYAHTATVLRTLCNVYGESEVLRALGRYARANRYRHPDPDDFYLALGEVLGDEARDNARRALSERGWVDYVAGDLQTKRKREPAGVFERDGGRSVVDRTESEPPQSEAPRWVGRVLVYRNGTLQFPVDVVLVNEQGHRSVRRWDGRGRWREFRYEGPSPLVAALVDPTVRVTLDRDLLNNARSRTKAGSPRTWERAAYWAELALGTFGP